MIRLNRGNKQKNLNEATHIFWDLFALKIDFFHKPTFSVNQDIKYLPKMAFGGLYWHYISQLMSSSLLSNMPDNN